MFDGFTNWLGGLLGGAAKTVGNTVNNTVNTIGGAVNNAGNSVNNLDQQMQQQQDDERRRRQQQLLLQHQQQQAQQAKAAQDQQDQQVARQKTTEGQSWLDTAFGDLTGSNQKAQDTLVASRQANRAIQNGDYQGASNISQNAGDLPRVDGNALDPFVNAMNAVAPVATAIDPFINAGAGALHALAPNNQDATNAFDRLNIGMSPQDMNRLKTTDPVAAQRAETMGGVMGWAGAPLGVLNAMTAGTTGPLIKQALKEGLTSDFTKAMLTHGLTKRLAVGGVMGSGIDAAGQDYMNNGDVTNTNKLDWGKVGESGVQGMGWSMIPEAAGQRTLQEEAANAGAHGASDIADLTHTLNDLHEQQKSLPTPEQIDQKATNHGNIEEGISSPSLTDQVRQDLTTQAQQAQEAIQLRYQQTLDGINQVSKSLMPEKLQPALADGVQYHGLQAPEKPTATSIALEASAPQKPGRFSKPADSVPVETPTAAESKAVASTVPSSVPTKEAVKSTGPASMSDEEIIQRFSKDNPGKTPDEIRQQFKANTEQLAKDKEVKAAQKAQQSQMRMAKASEMDAAAQQAAKDAGVAPDKPAKQGRFAKAPEAALAKPSLEEAASASAAKNREWADAAKESIKNAEERLAKETNIAKAAGMKTTGGLKEAKKSLRDAKAMEKNFTDNANSLDNVATPTPKTVAPSEQIAESKAINPTIKDGKPVVQTIDTTTGKVTSEMKVPTKPAKQGRFASQFTPEQLAQLHEDAKQPAKPVTEVTTPPAETTVKTVSSEKSAPLAKPAGTTTPGKGRFSTAGTTPAKPAENKGIMEGSQKTGRTLKSQGAAGKAGRLSYEEISHITGREAAAEAAKNTDIAGFIKHVEGKVEPTYGDSLVAEHLMERATPGSPEAKKLYQIQQSTATKGGQLVSGAAKTSRKDASSRQLQAQYYKKLNDKGIDLSKEAAARVSKASDAFTEARDQAKVLEDKARGDLTKENVKAYREVAQKVDTLDRQAKLAEYREAVDAATKDLKPGEKLPDDQQAFLKKLKRDTGVFQFDAVDSSLLSSTGTMLNNTLNGILGLGENIFHGNMAGKSGRKLGGEINGGRSFRGMGMGFKRGLKSVGTEYKLRNEMNSIGTGRFGKAWGKYKNIVTTGNELGEGAIHARIESQLYSHYEHINKKAGMSGEELHNRTELDTLSDPNGLRQGYSDTAYAAQGMASLSKGLEEQGKQVKFETYIKNKLRDSVLKKLGASEHGKAADISEWMAKAITRFTIGFPSVIVRSGLQEGLKRTPLGLLTDGMAIRKAATPAEKSRLWSELIQHQATHLTYATAGVALGASGLMSGAYPTDPNEQKRWQKEGKTEWSINLGMKKDKNGNMVGDWYDVRKPLGAFALPLMLWAQAGQNIHNGDNPLTGFVDPANGPLTALLGVTPIDGLTSNLTKLNQIMKDQKVGQNIADMSSQFLKMGIPAEGAWNELAKISTALIGGYELETKDANNNGLKQFLNDMTVTVPGGGEAMGLDPKVVDNVKVTSISPLGKILGAQKGYNEAGAANNAQAQAKSDANANGMAQEATAAGKDSVSKVRDMLDPANQGLYDKFVEGRQLAPEKLKTLEQSIKNIADATKGYDSKFAQEGDWKSHMLVLQAAQKLQDADPQTMPTQKADLQAEITRVGVAKKNNFDPQVYSLYRSISNSEFNAMLNPYKTDVYNPDMAAKLMQMDNAMTAAGASRNGAGADSWTRNKFVVNRSSGSGSGSNQIATNVPSLTVQQTSDVGGGLTYRKTVGGLPTLLTDSNTPQKPNYKRNISVTRGVQL